MRAITILFILLAHLGMAQVINLDPPVNKAVYSDTAKFALDGAGTGSVGNADSLGGESASIWDSKINAKQNKADTTTYDATKTYVNVRTTLTTNRVAFGSGTNTITSSSDITYNDTNKILSINGGVQVANISATAGANNVGTLRYRKSGNNTYIDVCMEIGTGVYEWVNIMQNNW